VQAMGLSGISKSTVSKLCKEIDERVRDFLERPLAGAWPYLWLDATYLRVRKGGRIVSVAAIIAVAVNTEGRREIIGLGLGPSEAETFWTEFLRGLKALGLDGVKLVISDAHTGLKAAIARVFEATWQRCRVGLLKNAMLLWGTVGGAPFVQAGLHRRRRVLRPAGWASEATRTRASWREGLPPAA
jgi:putative transposase